MAIQVAPPIEMKLHVVRTARPPDFHNVANRVVTKDLGLRLASRGMFTARRVKAAGRWSLDQIASRPGAWFSFLYLLSGEMVLRGENGTVQLHAHDGITQLPLTGQSIIDVTPALEFMEFQAPETERVRRYLPERPTQIVSFDAPEMHFVGRGLRDFFDYRDLGVAEATGRRLEVQVVRAQRAREGGTGWHSHSMAQMTYGLSGWALIDVEGAAEPVLVEPGDALCIPSKRNHNAGSFSNDYCALQIQIPADFDTAPMQSC